MGSEAPVGAVAGVAMARRDSSAASPDYERAIKVLERCGTASCVTDFKGAVVEALGSSFGFHHVSFFAGPTFQTLFNDRNPIVSGSTVRMLPEYQERWSTHDIFGTPTALRMLRRGGVASISELTALGSVPLNSAAYLHHFVVGTWRMKAAAAIRIELYGMHTGLVGVFSEHEDQLGPNELATLRLLSSQLSAIARGIPFVSARRDFSELTDRQRDVMFLLSEGLSNAQIALTLSLAEDSIKKYVSRILAATGCHTRLELALVARTGVARSPRLGPGSGQL